LDNISWTDLVRKKVLHRIKQEYNICHTARRKEANCIGHMLFRNCFQKHVIEGTIEGESEGKTRNKT
jgi:hypothetical protein